MISGLISVASLALGGVLVGLTVLALLSRLRVQGWVAKGIAAYILAYACGVLVVQAASECRLVGRLGLLAGHAVLALVVLPLCRRGESLRLRGLLAQARAGLAALRQRSPLLFILLLGAAIVWIVDAGLILFVPPNTWDSYLYHLSRVAHWLQNGTLRHFATQLDMRNAYPVNGEIAMLWLSALWGSDRLTGFVQAAAALALTASIYGAARQLKFTRSASLYAALIWNVLTIVVVQTTSTKNDLLLAAFCSSAVFFLLRGLRHGSRSDLLLFGAALGLALGTKTLAIWILPGIALIAIAALIRHPRSAGPLVVRAAACALLGFVLLGSYAYILNWLDYGNLGGPPVIQQGHLIEHPSLELAVANFARLAYDFFDLGGLPYPLIFRLQPLRSRIGAAIFTALGIDPNPSGSFSLLIPFDFNINLQLIPRDDASWYGPLGWLVWLPAVIWEGVRGWRRPETIQRSVIALAVLAYVLGFAATLYWMPWTGRLLMPAVALGCPLVAGLYPRRRALRAIVVAAALILLGWSTAMNFHKPLFGSDAIWRKDEIALRTIQAPEIEPIYRAVNTHLAPDAHVGVMGPWPAMYWDTMFYGPKLSRDVVDLGETLQRVDADLLASYQLDALVVAAPQAGDIESDLPLEELGCAWELCWYMLESVK